MKKEKFLEKARFIHGYKYNYINLPDKITYNDYVEIVYDGVIYNQKVSKHIMLGKCPEKAYKLGNTEKFIEDAKKIWGDKYDYSLVEYKGSASKVKIIFNGVIYEQTPSSHLRKWAPEKNMNHDSFIKNAREKWGEKYDYSLVKFVNSNKKVKILYNGVVYEQTPKNHLKFMVERINYNNKTTDQFINESNIIHDFKYNYENTIYNKSNLKVIITCPIHGDFQKKPQDHLNGEGCPNCLEYIGQKEISKFLKKYNILFERQKVFDDCKNKLPLPFDFYIEKKRMCIEFDSIDHFQPVSYFGGVDRYNNIIINDKIKNEYCEENYINLIRIKYDQIDEIYKILYENLKNYLKKI